MIPRFRFSWIVILSITILLTACWDHRLLRDHSLVLSIGYDRGENEGIIKTVTIPQQIGGENNTQQNISENGSTVISMLGNTVKDAEKNMDKVIPEKFDRSKTRVILFGEELARQGIFSTLDSVYRDLRGPLNAKVAIYSGIAQEALSTKSEQPMLTSDIYAQLLNSAEQAGITKTHNVQTACPILLAQGKDLVLPLLSQKEGKTEVNVAGLALFHEDQMTGTLNTKETSMFLILSDQITENTSLNLKITEDKEDHNKNFVNIALRHNKRKLSLHVAEDKIQAVLDVTLKIEIDEFASDHLYDEHKVKALSKEIEGQLTDLADETLAKMQEAKNDSLGIGEKLRAFHHDTWKKIDWKKEYPDMPIKTTFNVDIIKRGIIN